MKLAAILLALSVPFSAVADDEEVKSARFPNGATIDLYPQVGPCVGGAKVAVWTSPDGKSKVPGCYAISEDQSSVKVVWFDTDAHVIAYQFFKARGV